MRAESCRKCGKELVPKEKCSVCMETIIFQCKTCLRDTEKSIHLNCNLIESDYKHLGARVA